MDERDVVTVTGPISDDRIGVALMHEHLFVDLSVWFEEPSTAAAAELATRKVEIALLGQLRRQPFSTVRDNLLLGDEDAAAEEVARFRIAGGSTIVDTTPPALKRDPQALRRLATRTGVNIVMGCGYYVEPAHPQKLGRMTSDDVARELIDELTMGVDGTGIRPGIIGEIGTSGIDRESNLKRGHLTKEEEKVLRGASRASLATGAAVSIHLDPRGEGADTVMQVLKEEGVAPNRIIMGHMDHVPSEDYQLRVADMGVYIQYDNCGREYYWDSVNVYWNNDQWRVQMIAQLISRGHLDQILLSQDVAMKMDLRAFGGYGYDHVLVDLVPALLRAGVKREKIDTILAANPLAALTGRRAPHSHQTT